MEYDFLVARWVSTFKSVFASFNFAQSSDVYVSFKDSS